MNIAADLIQQYNTALTVCEAVINSDHIALLILRIIQINQSHEHYFNTVSLFIHTDVEPQL